MEVNQLGTTDFILKARHSDGPLGERYVVQSRADHLELLADLVNHEGDDCLTAVCRNATRTTRATDEPSIANVLESGWLSDGRYFQVLELSPNVTSASERPELIAGSKLLTVASSLVTALKHLHSRELLHGALSPPCVYYEGDSVRVAELWFAHNADGKPLHRDLSQFFPATVPDYAWHFMAPEVLLGYPPMRESDVFSLGAVLFYLASGETLRELPPSYPQGAMLEELAEAPIKSLPRLCPDLDAEIGGMILSMLAIDPGERPSTFLLADLFRGLIDGFTSGDEELEESLT